MVSTVSSLNAELRAADEQLVGNDDILRAVLAGCGDCIKILDLQGQLQFMSEAGKQVMEVDDFSLLKGCPWPDFWAGEGNDKAREAIETARTGRTGRFKGAANTVKGSPRYWDVQVSPVFGGDGEPTHFLSISRDITAEWNAELKLKEAAERQSLLSEEMNHRLNNTLALVGAIAAQTIRGNDIETARRLFISRLATLANANKILLQSDWKSVGIAAMVDEAVAPHRSSAPRILASGPDFRLPSKQALSLALAIHELATNAIKYGALSNDDGIVTIMWQLEDIDDEIVFVFKWEESGGPSIPSRKPDRKGFGSRLINTMLAQDFGGDVTVDFEPDGIVCELRSPADVLTTG